MSARIPAENSGDFSLVPHKDGYALYAASRPVLTENGRILWHENENLMQAVLDERLTGEGRSSGTAMSLSLLLSACIDSDEDNTAGWAGEILGYLGTDLLCYRAPGPEALVSLQNRVWNPYLDRFRSLYGVSMVTVTGIVAVEQPQDTFDTVRCILSRSGRPALAGLRAAARITGSAVLALLLWQGGFSPEAVFEASCLDSRFREDRRGVREPSGKGLQELETVSRFLCLVKTGA